VVRRPVSTEALEAILRKCVLIARAKRTKPRREPSSWKTRARRWFAARTRQDSDRRRAQIGLIAAALLIGVLLAATWSSFGAIAPLAGDTGLDRFWRMSVQDMAERRLYRQQQLELDRQMNDETRRHYEAQQRRELPYVRPVYPSGERP
jgi:hypothetical protein